jgi:hypothetical protein
MAMKDAKRIFEQSVEQMDVATSNRLRLLRRDALMQSHSSSRPLMRWLPAGLVTACLALAAVLWFPQDRMQNSGDIANTETLLLEEETEMLDWLADAPVAIDETPGAMQ